MTPSRAKRIAVCCGAVACAIVIVSVILGYPSVKRAWRWSRLKALAGTDLRALDRTREDELLDELAPAMAGLEEVIPGYFRERWGPWALFPLQDERDGQRFVFSPGNLS